MTIVDEGAPAFALSLAIVALSWLPLRDVLARQVLRRREPLHGNLFRREMDAALTPPGIHHHPLWRTLPQDAFRPLAIAPAEVGGAPVLLDEGLALAVPGPGGLPGYRLEYSAEGRKLFAPRDAELAAELSATLANALESRE